MELEWPINIICNEKRSIKIRTATSAYADDTQWIAKSKSEIIVVNPEDNNENERFIEIGKNKDKVFANKGSDSIRILGV
ncbi:14264_t:CDS:2 [Rhizophagus irregularis]|nr:14264_t:CDS:2 [Rhizophagus irregularis]